MHYILVMYSFNLHHLLLLQSRDIEINHVLWNFQDWTCHWNLGGIAADDFVNVTLIEAFNNANNIDIICLSDTFLDSTIPLNDERLYINGHSMIRADHPSNTKRGGVCKYYK